MRYGPRKSLIANAKILQCTEEMTLIRVASEANQRQLRYPGIHKAIQRTLMYVGDRLLKPQSVERSTVGEVCAFVT